MKVQIRGFFPESKMPLLLMVLAIAIVAIGVIAPAVAGGIENGQAVPPEVAQHLKPKLRPF